MFIRVTEQGRTEKAAILADRITMVRQAERVEFFDSGSPPTIVIVGDKAGREIDRFMVDESVDEVIAKIEGTSDYTTGSSLKSTLDNFPHKERVIFDALAAGMNSYIYGQDKI